MKQQIAKPTKTSKAWMREHLNDPYVKLAQKEGYRSRAAYKLMEINEKDHLFRQGALVADLGAAPGSWSQVAAKLVGAQGRVFALDILPMEPIRGVEFIQGDFREDAVYAQMVNTLAGRKLGLVISDLAPNMSGMSVVDQARSLHLIELALAFTEEHLQQGGCFLVKAFQGSGYQEFVKLLRTRFDEVLTRKPKASRDRSNEVYLLAKGLRAA